MLLNLLKLPLRCVVGAVKAAASHCHCDVCVAAVADNLQHVERHCDEREVAALRATTRNQHIGYNIRQQTAHSVQHRTAT